MKCEQLELSDPPSPLSLVSTTPPRIITRRLRHTNNANGRRSSTSSSWSRLIHVNILSFHLVNSTFIHKEHDYIATVHDLFSNSSLVRTCQYSFVSPTFQQVFRKQQDSKHTSLFAFITFGRHSPYGLPLSHSPSRPHAFHASKQLTL